MTGRKEDKTHVNQDHGMTFEEADPAQVIDFLRGRRLQKFQVAPEDLQVANDGTKLVLRMYHGVVSEFPIREAFTLKLLKWYAFPARQLRRLCSETVCSILNDFLLNIKSGDVTLTVENGEALSLTSRRYSFISDLEVLATASPLGLASVSRNDFFTRIYTKLRHNSTPIINDACGMGFNVFNSETGFHALAVHHFVLRYICTNGAIIQVGSGTRQRIHYGHPASQLRDFMQNEMHRAQNVQKRIAASIQKRSTESCRPMLEETKKRLTTLAGKEAALGVLESLGEGASLFDLANAVTRFARTLDIGKRLQAETIGGEILAGVIEEDEQNKTGMPAV